MLKRGYTGVYQHFSVMRLNRYVQECSWRHDSGPLDTESQMRAGCAANACAMKTLSGRLKRASRR